MALTRAAVFALLLGIAAFLLRATRREDSLGDSRFTGHEVAPGIAVLPFVVRHDSLASWREGLVDLVSIDLSGVTGLRPIDSRTLLARWRERLGGEDPPALEAALDVAQRSGARYAVVGSVIADGPTLFLSAGVHDVARRRMLGTARSQGPADSVFTLVDQLTLGILRLVLGGDPGGLPRIDLARLSTSSLPAIKWYLQGEVLFRRSQFQAAAEAYARATEADSAFALARYRLGISRQWSWTDMTGSLPDPLYADVAPVADRLPPHERALFRAIVLSERDVGAARELLEGEVRRHPEQAETWYELGEFYHHFGEQALAPREAADRAFARAIELDSTFTIPYLHRLDRAVRVADSTAASRLLDSFARLAPESRFADLYGLVIGLAFGDTPARSAAEAALDTLEVHDLFWLAFIFHGERCCWTVAEKALREARDRDELQADATVALFRVSLAQGEVGEALGWIDDPLMPEGSRARMLQLLDELGVAIPAARLDAVLTLGPTDSADALALLAVGAYAASRGRWEELQQSLKRLRSYAARLRAMGDSSEAGFTEAVGQGLEGYAWWRQGQRDLALRLLEDSQRRAVGNWRRELANCRLRWWLAQLLLEMGRPAEAVPYLESLARSSIPSDYVLGRTYQRLRETDGAREAYRRFLAQRPRADPMVRPMIREARSALARLAVAGR